MAFVLIRNRVGSCVRWFCLAVPRLCIKRRTSFILEQGAARALPIFAPPGGECLPAVQRLSDVGVYARSQHTRPGVDGSVSMWAIARQTERSSFEHLNWGSDPAPSSAPSRQLSNCFVPPSHKRAFTLFGRVSPPVFRHPGLSIVFIRRDQL